MGNWNLNITGTGPHHNQNPQCDVDLLARELVTKLVSQGHKVDSARLHHGAIEEFAPGVKTSPLFADNDLSGTMSQG